MEWIAVDGLDWIIRGKGIARFEGASSVRGLRRLMKVACTNVGNLKKFAGGENARVGFLVTLGWEMIFKPKLRRSFLFTGLSRCVLRAINVKLGELITHTCDYT